MNARCRGCDTPLTETFADLGTSPLSNAYRSEEQLATAERYYPLHALVCSKCFFVQLEEFKSPEAIFSDYAYFSSYSDTWLEHCRKYVAATAPQLPKDSDPLVVEIASNDGYLLQYFIERGIRVVGVEPAANVAEVARERGVPTEVRFFGEDSARVVREKHGAADLMIANNVLAHVPNIHDFVQGFAVLLAPQGRASFEFPHLLRLIEESQFYTIYHEHFSYLSLLSLTPVFESHGLSIVDVEQLPTHGGSLRVWVAKQNSAFIRTPAVDAVLSDERRAGLNDLSFYREFAQRVLNVKRGFLSFLLDAQAAGKSVAAYGAAAKGNTLLNYCGVRPDLISCVADLNPHKQNRFLPGSRIPVVSPERLLEQRPDYVVILPWNIRDEVVRQMSNVRAWGGSFVVAIPELRILS